MPVKYANFKNCKKGKTDMQGEQDDIMSMMFDLVKSSLSFGFEPKIV